MDRVEVDLNYGGRGRDGRGLTVLARGNLRAVEDAGIELRDGMPLLLADQDGFDDGSPAWLEIPAVVERDGDRWVAVWHEDDRRWTPRN
jgi:hypothetical protein